MSTLRDTLLEEFSRHFVKECWAGPAVMEVLNDITAEQAIFKPIPNAHSTWELVLHMVTWIDVGRWRLEGNEHVPTDEENFPPVTDNSEAAWAAAQETLRTSYNKLIAAIGHCDDEKLAEQIPAGKGLTHLARLNGIIQHSMYHAGQIGLMKKTFEQ